MNTLNKPQVKVSTLPATARPTIETLGDVLKETANHLPDGFTCINASIDSQWYELVEGERDTIYLEFDAVTACINVQNDVTVFIRQNVSVANARALLDAAAKQIKAYDSLKRFTPLERVSDDCLPF